MSETSNRETQVRAWVADVCGRALGIEPSTLAHDADLALHGMTSVQSVVLLGDLEERIGADLPTTFLKDHGTVDALVAFVLARTSDAGAPAPQRAAEPGSSFRTGDFSADATLDLDLDRELDTPASPRGEPRSILLTGATGFLGAFLVRDLLERTSATIHCVVRAPDAADGARRLRENLARYSLWDERHAARVAVVVGDLEKPGLGWTARERDAIADRVDTIHHNGAWVNWLVPYETMRAVNVESTRELLRLSCTGRPKPFHFVSTFSVGWARDDHRVRTHADPLATSAALRTGYAQTKWVAERLVVAAGERSLPVSIYRPSFLQGASSTGAKNSDVDFWTRMIKTCVDLGCAPRLDVCVDMVPVDFASRAIVELSLRPSGGVHYIASPAPVPWGQWLDWVDASGYSLERVPFEGWLASLRARAVRSGDVALAPFTELFDRGPSGEPSLFDVILGHSSRPLPVGATFDALAGTSVPSARVDAAIARTWLAWLETTGFLAPRTGASR